jgi:ribosomal protein S12 methylthiotransferase accessory factor
MVENVRIDIYVPNDFPEKYKNAVVKAADLCSVKRHLQNPPTIDIKIVSG